MQRYQDYPATNLNGRRNAMRHRRFEREHDASWTTLRRGIWESVHDEGATHSVEGASEYHTSPKHNASERIAYLLCGALAEEAPLGAMRRGTSQEQSQTVMVHAPGEASENAACLPSDLVAFSELSVELATQVLLRRWSPPVSPCPATGPASRAAPPASPSRAPAPCVCQRSLALSGSSSEVHSKLTNSPPRGPHSSSLGTQLRSDFPSESMAIS